MCHLSDGDFRNCFIHFDLKQRITCLWCPEICLTFQLPFLSVVDAPQLLRCLWLWYISILISFCSEKWCPPNWLSTKYASDRRLNHPSKFARWPFPCLSIIHDYPLSFKSLPSINIHDFFVNTSCYPLYYPLYYPLFGLLIVNGGFLK